MVLIVFILGLAIGSFLNAYIWRLHISEALPPAIRRQGLPVSVWRGRSMCPKCKKPLAWYELIPLVSFALQRGRCRGCKGKIDWQYPLVELAAGILFVLAYIRFDIPTTILHSTFFILHFYLLATLVILFVYDLRYGLVPDRVVLPAILVAFLFSIMQYNVTLHAIRYTLYAIFVGAGFFALQYYLSRGRWLGAGDIRIGALMGAMLGWPFILEGLVISYAIGGVFALALIVARKKQFGQTLPLGTFLTLGTAIVFLYGEQIWRWYFNV